MSATILVVEDEVDLLFTIALSLELNGYRVVKAASGEEAGLSVQPRETPADGSTWRVFADGRNCPY